MQTYGKRVHVFIDASNLWEAQKAKGKFLDYLKLKQYLKERFHADELKLYYYTAYPKEGTRDYSLDGKHKFFTYLSKGLGIVVRKKELKRIAVTTKEGVAYEEKGNMDVEMAIDIVHTIQKYDLAILFSGDSDFLSLVRYVKNAGKEMHVFSSFNNISQELRTGSDSYTDLLDLSYDIWGKELTHRASLK